MHPEAQPLIERSVSSCIWVIYSVRTKPIVLLDAPIDKVCSRRTLQHIQRLSLRLRPQNYWVRWTQPNSFTVIIWYLAYGYNHRHIVLNGVCGKISLIFFRLDGPKKSKVTKWAQNSLSTLVLLVKLCFGRRTVVYSLKSGAITIVIDSESLRSPDTVTQIIYFC